MRVCCISDMHGMIKKIPADQIPECDLLIIAGDFSPGTPMGTSDLTWINKKFRRWLNNVPAKEIVGIAGNHDFVARDFPEMMHELPWHFLNENHKEVAGKLIYGSPFSVSFGFWPYMASEDILARKWNQIDNENVEILVIHGPPYKVGDLSLYGGVANRAGSRSLRDCLDEKSWPNLKLIVCGHIHEGHGIGLVKIQRDNRYIDWVNGSFVNQDYQPVNSPQMAYLS